MRYEYICGDMRPLTSDNVRGAQFAARIFANRIARQKYGRRGKLVELEQEKDPTGPPRRRTYFYSAWIGAQGQNLHRVRFELLQTRLPNFTRDTAIETARQLAAETGKDWIAFCLNGAWDRVAHTGFRHDRETPGLTEILRVSPRGEPIQIESA